MAASAPEAGTAASKTDLATLMAKVGALRQAAAAAQAVAEERANTLRMVEADNAARARAKAEADARAKEQAADARAKEQAEAEHAKAEAVARDRLAQQRAGAREKAETQRSKPALDVVSGGAKDNPETPTVHSSGSSGVSSADPEHNSAPAVDDRQVEQQWLSTEQHEAAASTSHGGHPRLMANHDAAASLPWPTDGFPTSPRKLGTVQAYKHLVWQVFVPGMPSLHKLMGCNTVGDLLSSLSEAQRACHKAKVAKSLWELLPPECKPAGHPKPEHPIVLRLGNIAWSPKAFDNLLKFKLPHLNIKEPVVVCQPNLYGDVGFVDLLFKMTDIRLAGTVVHTFHGRWSSWSELNSVDSSYRMLHICLPQVCALFPCLADPSDRPHCSPHHLCQAMYYMFSHKWDDVCEDPGPALNPSDSSTRPLPTEMPPFNLDDVGSYHTDSDTGRPEYNEDSGGDNPWHDL